MSTEKRWELRAVADRLPYSSLEYLAGLATVPSMHRAEAKRAMRRRNKAHAAWMNSFLSRLAK